MDDGVMVPGSLILDVYEPMAGWKARLMGLYRHQDGDKSYVIWEPLETGFCGHATKEGALAEMREWSIAEEIPTIEDTTHKQIEKDLGVTVG